MDDPGQPPADPGQLLTLTEAAERTGHTREAIRQRVRRGSLPSVKGNDGQVKVHVRDLSDLPPPENPLSVDDQVDATLVVPRSVYDETVADLRSTVADQAATLADLRSTTDREISDLRSTMDRLQTDRLADHGRAERAEAVADAERARAAAAEARLVATEAALAEARTPWLVRVIRAGRRSGS